MGQETLVSYLLPPLPSKGGSLIPGNTDANAQGQGWITLYHKRMKKLGSWGKILKVMHHVPLGWKKAGSRGCTGEWRGWGTWMKRNVEVVSSEECTAEPLPYLLSKVFGGFSFAPHGESWHSGYTAARVKVNHSQGDGHGGWPERWRSVCTYLLVQSALSVLEDKGTEEK